MQMSSISRNSAGSASRTARRAPPIFELGVTPPNVRSGVHGQWPCSWWVAVSTVAGRRCAGAQGSGWDNARGLVTGGHAERLGSVVYKVALGFVLRGVGAGGSVRGLRGLRGEARGLRSARAAAKAAKRATGMARVQPTHPARSPSPPPPMAGRGWGAGGVLSEAAGLVELSGRWAGTVGCRRWGLTISVGVHTEVWGWSGRGAA
mmetsp:Transcript_14798/g.26290  ORF Transcript_14798/g.26290 Transcript_14798/m.26290 type:complete len:205 (-) Transcript_14798:14-628(-)